MLQRTLRRPSSCLCAAKDPFSLTRKLQRDCKERRGHRNIRFGFTYFFDSLKDLWHFPLSSWKLVTSCAANFLHFTLNYSLLFNYHFKPTVKRCRDVRRVWKKFWILSKRLKGQKAAATCDALKIHNDEVILLMKTSLLIQSRGADHGKCPLTSDPPLWGRKSNLTVCWTGPMTPQPITPALIKTINI